MRTLDDCCRHAETSREYWTVGLDRIVVNCFKSWLLDIPSYRSIYIINYELPFADGAGTITQMVPTDDGGHIPAIYGDLLESFSKDAKTLQLHWSIEHAIDLEPGYQLPYGWITI